LANHFIYEDSGRKTTQTFVRDDFFPFEALQNMGRSRTKLEDKEKTFTSTGVNSLFLNHSVY
jgi:hypothetical protein